MALRIRFNSDALGPFLFNDAIGINELTENIHRGDTSDGLFFAIILDIEMQKGARRYLIEAYETSGGTEAVVTADLEQYDPNTYTWEGIYSGSVDFSAYDKGESTVKVIFEEGNGFQNKVLNGFEIVADLETLV